MIGLLRVGVRLLVGLGVAVVGVIAAGAAWMSQSVPDYNATLRVEGLDAPVQIIRDQNAVPHIFAADDNDAYFALGFLHAQDRMWQMDLHRRIGAGRLSELVGARALPADRLMRVLGLHRRAEGDFLALSRPVQRALQAYADGVNAWMATRSGPLPIEFTVLWYEPEPWTPADSLVWGQIMALQLSQNYRSEILRARIANRLGEGVLDTLFPADGADAVSTLGSAAPQVPQAPLDRLAGALAPASAAPPFGPGSASNVWAVTGDRSRTGAALLANDPHLALMSPSMWYLARIEAPSLSLTGATVPGSPFHILGHNGAVAWGLTSTSTDVQDLFVERLDPDNPGLYLTPDGPRPFDTREEVIRVRFGDPVTLTVRETRHGPVISDIDADAAAVVADGHVLALAFTGFKPRNTTAQAYYALNRAQDWDGVVSALRSWKAPLQNVIGADTRGTIGFYLPGRIPIRRNFDGTRPVPGWTGDYAWEGEIPFEALPNGRADRNGVFVNANESPVSADYPHFLARRHDPGYRARRIKEALAAQGPHSLESFEAIITDTVSLAARDVLPLMLVIRAETAETAEALALLNRWDFAMAADRPEPLIFIAWLEALHEVLLEDELGALFGDVPGPDPKTIERILTREPGWCDDRTTPPTETCQQALKTAFDLALGRLGEKFGRDVTRWRWGDAHQAPNNHPLFGFVPVLSALFDARVETPGGPFTVNRGNGFFKGVSSEFEHTHGAGLRALYDMAAPDQSLFMISTGQSGNPFSHRYGDLAGAWAAGEHFRIHGTPAELTQQDLPRLTLRPDLQAPPP